MCIINSLWPSDTIWQHRSGSTLAQVMACCLTAPNHYLNQCWRIISEVQWRDIHIRAISQEMPQPSLTKICLKITCLKFHSNFPGGNELKCYVWRSFDSKWGLMPGMVVFYLFSIKTHPTFYHYHVNLFRGRDIMVSLVFLHKQFQVQCHI